MWTMQLLMEHYRGELTFHSRRIPHELAREVLGTSTSTSTTTNPTSWAERAVYENIQDEYITARLVQRME